MSTESLQPEAPGVAPDPGGAAETEGGHDFLLHRTMRAASALASFWAARPYAFAGAEDALEERAREVDEFFTVAAEHARDLTGAELAAIGVGGSPDRPFDPWIAVGVPDEIARAIGRIPRPVGTLGVPVHTGEPVRVDEVRRHPAFAGLPPGHPEIRSLLAVPVQIGDQTFGTLYVANKRGGGAFDRVDESVVRILSTVTMLLTTIERDRSRLHQILEAGPDGIVYVDARTGHVLANQAFYDLFGAELVPERGVAQELGAVLSPEGDPLSLADMPSSRALAGETTVDRELVFLRRDGRRVPVRARAAPIVCAAGTVVGAVVTYRDFSAQKRLLATIDRDRRSLRTILEAAPDGILFLDTTTGKIDGNRAFEALLGRPIDPDGGIEQALGAIHSPDDGPVALADLPSSRALTEGGPVERELVFLHADGRRVPVIVRAAPALGADGSVHGVVVTCRDATTQKELDRLRREFAAMVAHDLRNPVQSLLVQIEILRAAIEQGTPIPATALDRLARLGSHVSRMASDLLDTSRVDLSQVPMDLTSADAGDAVRAVVDRVRPTAGDHTLDLRVEAPLPPVRIDAMRFGQALTNVLENAIKYSAPGTAVEVEVRAAEGGIDVAVRDRGPGIAPEDLPKLFDRFYQVGRAREQRTGLGLGLYIAKGYVEAQGGRLRVDSAEQRGSTFHLWLPAAPGASAPP